MRHLRRGLFAPLLLLSVAACENIDISPEAKLAVTSEGPVQHAAVDYRAGSAVKTNNLINLFEANYQQAIASPENAATAFSYYNSGAELVRSSCQEFFTYIGNFSQNAGFAQDMVALGGSAAGAFLGIVGASAQTLALLAAGVTTALGIGETYSNAYLFNPDVMQVQELVWAVQDGLVAKARANDGAAITSFYLAQEHLRALQRSCEVHAIRSEVNKALNAGTLRKRDEATRSLESSSDAAYVAAIAQHFGQTSLSNEQLAAILWLVGDGLPQDDAQKAKAIALIMPVLKSLPADKSPFDSAGNLKANWPDNKPFVEAYFANLSSERTQLLAGIQSEWVTQAVEAAAKKT